ncbi:MAG: hypothetical protein ACE5HQ_07840 [Gemmatimonadota bacterium]
MSEHLAPERIAALLDEVDADRPAREHLDRCAACHAEYERFTRMKMALSGLGELEPPAREWERVLERLDASLPRPGLSGEPRSITARLRRRADRRRRPRRAPGGWPLQAAAAAVLFAGGILAGLQLTGGSTSDLTGARNEVSPEAAAATARGFDAAYASTLAELDALREPLPSVVVDGQGVVDPMAAAERLARFDAFIHASQQAVEDAPADPVANGLLFQLVDDRDALARRLERSLHLASVEYR